MRILTNAAQDHGLIQAVLYRIGDDPRVAPSSADWVENRIVMEAGVRASDVAQTIAGALYHDFDSDASRVLVEMSGRDVTLSGTVRSWIARHVAERAAWRTPGVAEVRNDIEVG